jgi:type I restriction enzyme S subunit
MTKQWPTTQLASLAASIKGAIAGGPFGSDLVSSDYVAEGVPVIRGVNLPFDSKISFDNLAFVTESKADSLHLNCAKAGDLVFTQRGTLGQVGILPEHPVFTRYLISQSQMKMTVDSTKADPLYLYYYFRLSSSVSYIENHALQSGVPHINLSILRKLEVIAPLLPVQKKIAAILSAYDDLIANNQRRIALLESMAEEIYREWFVRMRFPSHGNDNCYEPDQWHLVPLEDLGTFLNGYAFDPTEWHDEGLPIIKIKELNSGISSDTPRNNGDKIPAKYRLSNGDIIFSWSGSLVVKIWNQGDALLNQHLFKVNPNEGISKEFLYLTIKFSIPIFASLTTGATMQHIKRKELRFVKARVPPSQVMAAFNALVGPLVAQALRLEQICACLNRQRDSLLPRLISGKLRVDQLDIQYPPSMKTELAAAH